MNEDGTASFDPNGAFEELGEGETAETTVTYTITDGNGGTDEATVTITVTGVNDAPNAVDSSYFVSQDEAFGDVDGDAITDDTGDGVDSDPEDDTLTVLEVDGDDDNVGSPVAGDNGGLFVINADGSVDFDANGEFDDLGAGENASTTVSYTITDGNGGTDTATVTFTVTGTNDAPVAVLDEDATDQDTVITLDNVLGNDSDPEGDDLTVGSVEGDDGNVGEPVEGSNGGLITINEDGTASFDPNGDFDELGEGETAQTQVTYTVTDGNGGTDETTVTITVTGTEDGPAAECDHLVVTQDEDAGDVDGNVLDNDSDPENDDLTVIGVNGDDTLVGTPVAGDNGGLITINPDGTYDFDANGEFDDLAPGETETTEVSYTITDGNGGQDTTTVVITVLGTNDDPVAVDDLDSTDFETPVTIDVLGNDSDPEDDPLSVLPGTVTAENGTVEVNPDGTLEYTPDPDFSGVDTITYTITDGNGGQDTATVSVTVGEDPRDGIVSGTDGDDLIDTDYVDPNDGDVIDGEDAILPGEDPNDDIVEAGDGDDTVISGDGSDTVYGGDGDDVIDTSSNNPNPLTDLGYPDTDPNTVIPFIPADEDPFDDRDTVFGGDGNDTITTGDDEDYIEGGTGDDIIDGGIDADTILGGDGDDRIVGGEGSDIIDGGDGDDTIYAGIDPDLGFPDNLDIPDEGANPLIGDDLVPNNGMDIVNGGDGNDTIFGADDDDTLNGDAGDDFIDGGIDDDTIDGGTGNDELIGGHGDDTITGGDGDDILSGGAGEDTMDGGDDRDTFDHITAGDTIDGGSGGDDYDVLDLRGSAGDGSLNVVYTGPDSNGNGFDGFVEYKDADGNVTGTTTFTEIEEVIPCFTPGTLIATPQGERLVQDLQVGDKIITRDNGLQEIRWMGSKDLTGAQLMSSPHLKPVLIRAGSLGNGLPERDMMVSPNHRMLISGDQPQLYFEESEVLAAAKHLVDGAGVQVVDVVRTSYIHFMFDQHEVVLSDGTWTESFQPGDYTLKGIDDAQRDEILELFPELAKAEGLQDYAAARRTLKKHEAKLLAK
ncbi:Ig-like domain-containing protein [Algirhabdus cladophorae]|uniref:Ig-like domain-containing protein n=1 Tax=Algirhabdus cladophorae TaxID=3377108 RepID=UPI003B84858F